MTGETGERLCVLFGLEGEEEGRGGTYDSRDRSYSSFRLKVMGLNGVSSSLSSGESIDGHSLRMKASRCLARERGSVETTIRQSKSEEFMGEDCGMTSAKAFAVGSARAMIKSGG